ncbi:MAG: pyridoxal 5'-phosphate synthase lyase subunit PdxS [Bdellovibrionaceae bacterium]|nr:pyridoxal 5'-phosphate synthase lyase subunit PdxS [Pseudobdellovibrionaceae bacterium]
MIDQQLVNHINLKTGLAEMLKKGVIMDVVTPEQARIAEDSGAIAVMALERVPSDIRRDGGVDYIDESEVLTPADESFHINKSTFRVPFVCGATNLGEALRRIGEGAALIRTKGEAGTGNIVEAVRHLRQINQEIRRVVSLDESELMTEAKILGAPYELLKLVRRDGKLPVPSFAAGGVATPADAALVMQLGAESVFVGSGIFKSENPEAFARAIVKAVVRFNDPISVLDASKNLPSAMPGLEMRTIANEQRLAGRGW